MAERAPLVSQIYIYVDGNKITYPQFQRVKEVIVDQQVHLPHMFMIRLHDPGLVLLDKGPFDLAKTVKICGASPTGNGTPPLMIEGEITSIEPSFQKDQVSELVVRGYDKSHRLYREVKSRAFLNVKDSDLATKIAGTAKLTAEVDATTTVYEHIFQDNQSDLAFLMERAWRIGYECFVENNKLIFRKPPPTASLPTLTWGTDLLTFHPRVTLAEQVDEVIVRGWNPTELKAIVGQKKKGALYPKNKEGNKGAAWAASFGTGKMVIVDQPVVSQAEADILAQARLDELSGTFLQAEGIALRRPDICAGRMVDLQNIGKRLSGSYMITSARHIYIAEDDLLVQFMVRGSRTGSLTEQMVQRRPLQKWTGVVTAIVTNTDDPKDWGRVKVKYPWMTDKAESFWARLIGAGAGPNAGYYAVPGVGDEVLVAFEHGDFNYPIVIGGLWNGKHAIPPQAAAVKKGEKPLLRTWHSRNGHRLTMDDTAAQKIELYTTAKHFLTLDDKNKNIQVKSTSGHIVNIDDQNQKIEITSAGGQLITIDDSSGKITIQSNNDLEVKAGKNLDLSGKNIKVQASGNLTLKGKKIKLN